MIGRREDRFPSSTEDGSIEASIARRSCSDSAEFPSSTEDGSIEATREGVELVRTNQRFRPQLRTAPLKHHVVKPQPTAVRIVSVLN